MEPVDYTSLTWLERRAIREQYVKYQNNMCYYCKESLDWSPSSKVTSKPIDWDLFPEGFMKHPTHLHHSHETGMTIGAVHNYCNAVLWQYEGE